MRTNHLWKDKMNKTFKQWGVPSLTRLTSGPPELPYCKKTKKQTNKAKTNNKYVHFFSFHAFRCIKHLFIQSQAHTCCHEHKHANSLDRFMFSLQNLETSWSPTDSFRPSVFFTHVDDGVCLDVVHVGVAEAQLLAPPLGGADDAGGDGVLQGERASYGHHELTWTKARRVAEQQHRQLHLQQTHSGGGETEKKWIYCLSVCTAWLNSLMQSFHFCSCVFGSEKLPITNPEFWRGLSLHVTHSWLHKNPPKHWMVSMIYSQV